MHTTIHEIAPDIFRISTFIPEIGPVGFGFNQFLIRADEPLLFHLGMRQLFPVVAEAVASIVPVESLRWLSFGHVEADECGAMNEWLAAAPSATVCHSELGVAVSIADLADREPRPLADGQVLDLGRRRVRLIPTPHVPHNWEATVLFEETTSTLFCGDLFTAVGDGPPLTTADLVERAMETERLQQSTGLSPAVGATIASLAELRPRTLATMHGSSFTGDGSAQLLALAGAYDDLFAETMAGYVSA